MGDGCTKITSLRGGTFSLLLTMKKIKVRIVKTARDGYVMKWRDAVGCDRQTKCSGRTQRARESERKSLEKRLNDRASELSWSEFWHKFDTNHLSQLSPAHRVKCSTMHKRMSEAASRRGIRDFKCSDVDSVLALEVESAMRQSDIEESTVRSNMASLWSMLSWGQDYGLIPDFRRPRRRGGKREKQLVKSKGRSLSGEEIDRMRAAIPLVCKRGEKPAGFLNAMKAMELIGMRLTECWLFSWDPAPGTHFPVLLDTSSAAIEFSNVQKSGVDATVPLTNEAIAWLRQLRDHRGDSPWVCRTTGARGEHATPNRLGRVISAAGEKANVVVKRFQKSTCEKIKYASAHDLRRTFATRLQRDLTISERQRLTRHANASTLLDHYADAPTPVLIAKLRGQMHPEPDSNGRPAD